MQILLSIASQFQNINSTYFRFSLSFLIIISQPSAPKPSLNPPITSLNFSLQSLQGFLDWNYLYSLTKIQDDGKV